MDALSVVEIYVLSLLLNLCRRSHCNDPTVKRWGHYNNPCKTLMIFVLKLQYEKYICIASDLDKQTFLESFNPSKYFWTFLYRPVEIIEAFDLQASELDNVTLEAMQNFGWEHVRGGSWLDLDIECPFEDQYNGTKRRRSTELEYVPAGAVRTRKPCIRCGFSDHEQKDCKAKVDINGVQLGVFDDGTANEILPRCRRCLRKGHSAKTCFEVTDVNGFQI